MHIVERSLQILLDDARYCRLAAAARERGTSIAAVVREAIDLALPVDHAKKRAALKAILEAEPTPMPDVDELKREIADGRSRAL